MNMFLIAVAMATAAPAVAQTAAPANPQAGHAGHPAPQVEGQHAGHSAPAAEPGQADPHAGHAMADCCRGDANGRMACCEDMVNGNGHGCCAEQGQQGQAADPHVGHDMSAGTPSRQGPNQN